MARKSYRVCNWKNYNRSLVARGSLTFWFNEEVVNGWYSVAEKKQRGRQRYYADMVFVCGLTLRQLFRLPLRATQGLLLSLVELLRLELRVPNYSTLCRRAQSLPVKFNVPNTIQARHVLIDATGVQVLGEGEWKTLRHGQSRHQVWRKLHITLDADNQLILSALMTDSVRLDGNYLRPLVESISGNIKQITGDGAYDKKACYRVAYERGAKAVFPPQHNAIVQRNKQKREAALLARDKVIRTIARSRDKTAGIKQWKQKNNYHRRSLIETMMFRMKSIFGDQMRSRSFANQQTDLLIRCHAMNKITQLGLPLSEAIT